MDNRVYLGIDVGSKGFLTLNKKSGMNGKKYGLTFKKIDNE